MAIHLRPISSLYEDFRVSRAREALLYWDSSDTRVASARIMVSTGRKWRAQEALEIAETPFPDHMIAISLKANIVLSSAFFKQVLLTQLTIP